MKKLIVLLVAAVAACNGVNTPTQTSTSLTPTIIPETQTSSPPTTVSASETSSPAAVTETPATPSGATTFPDSNAYTWQQSDTPNPQRPVDLQATGSGRLFVLEKGGRIRIIENDQLLETPFLDITDRVGSNGNEQGLLGLAFHPGYQENGRFFV